MRCVIAAFAIAVLGGCGLETASTAAAGAAIKKQELDQAKKTMEQAQQKIGQTLELQQQQQERAAESAEK